MKTASILSLSLSLLAAAPARAEVGFFAHAELAAGGTAQVARPSGNVVEYALNTQLVVSPIEVPPGCGLAMTKAEATQLGELYLWVASNPPVKYGIDQTVFLKNGGKVRVIRSLTSATIDTILDDGTNLTSISSDCFGVMFPSDADMVGGWLLAAVGN
jgi:hypothetical protein